MKRFVSALIAVLVVSVGFSARVGATGNGAPSGPHYDLNIHGVQQGGSMSTSSNGHDIWVPINSNGDALTTAGCDDILLQPASTFQVVYPDCQAAHAAGAKPATPQFNLPCLTGTAGTYSTTACTAATSTTYSVWARVVAGKGTVNANTCLTDSSGTVYCYAGTALTLGKSSKFTNATNSLLYFCTPVTTNGVITGYQWQPIFANSNYNYYWDWDQSNVRLTQLRFYYQASNQPAPTGACSTSPQF